LDQLVWQDVCQVLTNPKIIEAALARAQAGDYLPEQVKQRRERLQQAATKLGHQLERLTEAYLSEVIKLEEYKRRRAELELKKEAIGSQVKELEAKSTGGWRSLAC
jgi:site-specific DNA recombinase